MSNRLDQEREARLQPKRIATAIEKLKELGKEITLVTETEVRFIHEREVVRFFPYSGWHTGKTITDGRGLQKLLRQLK